MPGQKMILHTKILVKYSMITQGAAGCLVVLLLNWHGIFIHSEMFKIMLNLLKPSGCLLSAQLHHLEMFIISCSLNLQT